MIDVEWNDVLCSGYLFLYIYLGTFWILFGGFFLSFVASMNDECSLLQIKKKNQMLMMVFRSFIPNVMAASMALLFFVHIMTSIYGSGSN